MFTLLAGAIKKLPNVVRNFGRRNFHVKETSKVVNEDDILHIIRLDPGYKKVPLTPTQQNNEDKGKMIKETRLHLEGIFKKEYFYFFLDKTIMGSREIEHRGHVSCFYVDENAKVKFELSFVGGGSCDWYKVYAVAPWETPDGPPSKKIDFWRFHLGRWRTFDEDLSGSYRPYPEDASQKEADKSINSLIGLPIKFFDKIILENNYRHIKEYRHNHYILMEGIGYREYKGQMYALNRVKKYNCINPVYNMFYRKNSLRNPGTPAALYLLLSDLFCKLESAKELKEGLAEKLKSLIKEPTVGLNLEYVRDHAKFEKATVSTLDKSNNKGLYAPFFSYKRVKKEHVEETIPKYSGEVVKSIELKCPVKKPKVAIK